MFLEQKSPFALQKHDFLSKSKRKQEQRKQASFLGEK